MKYLKLKMLFSCKLSIATSRASVPSPLSAFPYPSMRQKEAMVITKRPNPMAQEVVVRYMIWSSSPHSGSTISPPKQNPVRRADSVVRVLKVLIQYQSSCSLISMICF